MAPSSESSSAKSPPKTPKGAKAKSAEKKKKPASSGPKHPPTSEMVHEAIATLKERNGSSLIAIKKYIEGNFVVDIQKMAVHIRKYLVSAVEKGLLVRTSGMGASGSFKLPPKYPKKEKVADDEVPKKKPAEKKAAKTEKKVKSPIREKSAKKSAVAKAKTPKPRKSAPAKSAKA